ncbi:MAG: glycosyltransferase family 9 protein [Ignavibacteriaceae bacterium]|nr:glycosyltransferase family 9 protein [Ignavibacteriaceae bacterium]
MDLSELKIPRCKNYNGYKPCFSYENCLENGCQHENDNTKIGVKILIISLDALGNVLDNTPVLYALKRKFPVSTIYWMTMPAAEKILFNNPLIDKVFTWTDEQRMIARQIEYDYVMNADKSDYACAFANEIKAKNRLGFLLSEDGKIIPANQGAMYSYLMGNNDEFKFRENKRSGVDIIHEAFELEYKRDPYVFGLTVEEKGFVEAYKKEMAYNPKKTYVGFNTGCSTLFPNKKMTIEQHVALIKDFLKDESLQVILLGGREDTERNVQIYESFSEADKKKIITTPTTMGLRSGICFMDIADIVITGDSFGMHMAIGLKKYVIAWFGLSCSAEIELYDRGAKLVPEGLECSPCWKKVCPYNLECIQMIDLNKIISLTKEFSLKIRK